MAKEKAPPQQEVNPENEPLIKITTPEGTIKIKTKLFSKLSDYLQKNNFLLIIILTIPLSVLATVGLVFQGKIKDENLSRIVLIISIVIVVTIFFLLLASAIIALIFFVLMPQIKKNSLKKFKEENLELKKEILRLRKENLDLKNDKLGIKWASFKSKEKKSKIE